MDIYNILASKPHNSYYLRRYLKFIEQCVKSNENYDGYTERHHICPKAKTMFPEFACLKENPWNLAILTARQHYIAHIILAKTYGGAMWLAIDQMTRKSEDHNRDYFITSRIYAKLREEKSLFFSQLNKDRYKGNGNPMYGRKGKKSPIYGMKRSKETRELQSKIRKDTAKISKCPICGKEGDSRMMKVWHFDNCGKVSRNKGNRNGNAKTINIYNEKDELIVQCNGNFGVTCKKMGIPLKPIGKSYRNKGKPILTSNLSKSWAERNNKSKFIGWYAKDNNNHK